MTLRGEHELLRLAQTVLSAVPADQAEVVVENGTSALTRFANNYIHQNVEATSTSVSVRAVLGKKVGVASTDVVTDEGLRAVAERAASIAALQQENQDFVSLPGPTPLPSVDAYRESTAAFTPEDRARVVGKICDAAREARFVAAGAFRTTVGETAVLNSLGVRGYHRGTSADITTRVMAETSSGHAEVLTLDASEIDGDAVAAEAIENCGRGANPQPLEPGVYPVILSEYAVADILDYFSYLSFGAQAFLEKRSFMSGRLGERVMGENVSIWDDGLSSDGIPIPFDGEGVAKQRVDIIEGGIARDVVWDSYYGGIGGHESTGHALPAGNTIGALPTNLYLGTGNASLEEMIASTRRGVFVRRFWYTRAVHPLTVVMTGMTRDGTYLIEDGKLAGPVNNLRFTQSYLEAMNNAEQIGSSSRLLLMDISGTCRVPPLKISAWNFSGQTTDQ